MWSVDADVPPMPKTKNCHFVGQNIIQIYPVSEGYL